MPFQLISSFSPCGDQPLAITQLVKSFGQGKKRQALLGVTGSGKTFTMAHVIQSLQKKTLVLAPNKTLAAQLYGEFKSFFPHNAVHFFVSYYDYYQPEAYVATTDTYIEKDSSINDEIDRLRHSATQALLEQDDVIVVASVSCIYGIGDKDEYEEHKITLFSGDDIGREKLLQALVMNQYSRNEMDIERGSFRVRGDTVEIFPPGESNQLVRVEFFGDTIENISLVDSLRGVVQQTLTRMTLYPASHYVVGEQKLDMALCSIREELRLRLQELEQMGKLVERQRLEQRTLLDLEMLEEMHHCSGIENYSRHMTGRAPGEAPPTLIDFFGDDFLLIVDESHIMIPQIGGMYLGDQSRKRSLVDFGFRLPSALDNRPLTFDEFDKKLDKVIYASATPGDYELKESEGEVVEQIIRPTGLLDPQIEIRSATTQVDDLLLEVKRTVKQGDRVLVTTLTKKLAEELCSYYHASGIKVKYLHSDIPTIERIEILQDLRAKKFDLLVGINLLREGLDLPEVSLVAILDADKEGYLRSTRSLIQTIGRAARNERGRVLLYAYKTTVSMQRAIDETQRRREKQKKYNLEHGMTPRTVQKAMQGGVMDSLMQARGKKGKALRSATKTTLSPEAIDKKIEQLKVEMKRLAKEWQFEEAAKVRDEIKALNELRLIF